MAMPGTHSAAGFAPTPKSASRRSSRRSWFDTPPATPLDIAVERQPMKTMNSRHKRHSVDDVETLVLSHFTKPPRISFGKVIVGRSKTRVLLVQNPAEYEQEVVIERFPYKKCFNVDQSHFMVQPEEVVSLTLTWTPQDAGGCREMVLFHVNDVYRLQAYMFGTVDDPKPVKKGRKGMLGTRQKQPLTSVVQTKSLKSIHDNYSPRKSEETRELRSHVRPSGLVLHMDQENLCPGGELEEHSPQTPPPLESTAICKGDERHEQKVMDRRKSGFLSPTLSKMSPIPLTADNNNGCIVESYLSTTTGCHASMNGGIGGERGPLKNVTGNGNKGQSRNSRESDRDKPDMSNLKKNFGRNVSIDAEKPKVHVSPNSFLNDSIAGKTTASTEAEVGQVRASYHVARVSEKVTVSPNSFVQNMGNKQSVPFPQRSSIPSPSAVLNDSIPHTIMMKQLEDVRKSLHDGSFHESPVLSTGAKIQVKPVPRPHPPGKVTDRLSQLAQPKTRNIFIHAQQPGIPGKKEKFLQRKLHEKACFAKITDVPSPRRKTFLITKKQQGKKMSPLKNQLQNGKRGRKGMEQRELLSSRSSSGVLKKPTADTEQARVNVVRVDSQTATKHCKKKEQVFPEHSKMHSVVPDDLHNEGITQDDVITDRRRSMWKSPAVAGFVSPVIAVQSDCDSTGDERQMLGNVHSQMIRAEDRCHPTQQASSQQVTLTAETDGDITKAVSQETEDKGGRSSGRHLFPGVISDDLNLSKDFRPLWSGSATVTKERPSSITPPFPGSANSSKKLFPEISTSAVWSMDTKSTPEAVSQNKEGVVDAKADHMKTGEIVGTIQANDRPKRGSKEKEAARETAESVEIVDMSVESRHSLKGQIDRSLSKNDMQKAEIVDMALTDGQLQRGKPERLFDDLQNTQEKSMPENMHLQGKRFNSFEWGSPQQLPQNPGSEMNRRSTLTVTKSRPSQALLDACNSGSTGTGTGRNVATSSQDNTIEMQGNENDSDELWRSETIIIETKNNNVVSFSVHREVLTPSELPSSPSSENSRRSTHAVKNPVVLNRDSLIPKNLFGSVPKSKMLSENGEMNDPKCVSETWGMVLKDKEQSHDVRQKSEMEETHEMDHIRQGIVTSVSDDSPLLDVYTDRVEHHISHLRDRIDRPGLCQPQPILDSSVSSQELSTDSLEAEKKANTDVKQTEEDSICAVRDTDVCGDVCKQDSCVSLKDGRECIANANSDVIDANENGASRQFITQRSSCSEIHMLEQSGAKAATSQHTYSHHFKTQNTSKLLSKDNKARVPRKIEPKESLSQEDATESFMEITPFLSATSVESKETVFEASGQYSVDYPVPPSPDSLARETWAKPITSSNIVKEALQKKGAKSEKTAESLSSATLSQDKKITPSHEGVLRRSLSASYHSSVMQPSQAGKPAAPTFKEMSLSHQKARTASVLVPKGQGLPKARSQGSLNRRSKPVELQSSTCAGQQTEQRFSRKRSSPEAGLKAPHSKRVELERHSTGRRTQQATSSRGIAPARPKARRAVKPSTGVALSKLILVKKSKTALPKHPLPFAAKNMYYDERWQDKQERGFVHWLNFVLTPADEYVLATTKTKVDARTIAFDGTPHQVAPRLAPTKEILSFRAYAARRRLNHLRRASCRLFQSEAVVRVVCRLELEVEQRRLAVRTDRMIHADIGLKQKILDLLLSYNPLWLRIGLETVYGEVLPIQTNSDVVGISRFVLTRLLTSPDISAHYAHPTVPHLYHDGYADAVAQHMLKKFLVLVYFLDNAKQSRLITHDPCLFCKDAEIKSTKDLLIQFSRDFLSGEGDITRHLAYMGYIVWHVQTPLDEFDYAVANLCTDLRDGLRLGRVVTLLSGDWTFAASLRAPAISRLQKIHNVELVFKQLAQRGLDLHDAKGAIMNPRDIVDGHREKTLAFLWKLIFHFQTVATLNEQELQEEVNILERTLRVKVCMQRLLGHPHSLQHCAARRDSGGPSAVMDNPMLQLLLKWCRTVCLHYGVKVENFTVSFSDGRALCCLLHHYHPALLPLENIQFRTSQSMQEDAENAGEGTGEDDSELSQDWGVNPLGGGELDQSLFDTLLVNEKENFRILYEKVSELGGIPLMLKAADMSNTIPDERVVVTYISYLCARLLDLREETRAARIIQLAWRRLCLRRSAHLRQKKIAACLVIQRAWRQHTVAMMTRKQEAAAVCLQASWRGHQARRRVALLRQAKINSAMHKAATQIQTCVRCFLTRRHYQRQHRAAITIQSWFRVHCAQLAFVRQRQACIVIQRRFRAHMEGATVRQDFASKKRSAVILQRAFRLRQLRRMENQNRAACLLQSAWRGRKCRGELLRQGQAAVMIQSWWRGNHAQTQFLKMRTACTIIQRQFRAARLGAEVRQDFLRLQWAAVTLQKHVRGYRQQRQFRHLKNSVLTLQKNFRGYKCRIKFQALRLATIIIQRAVRSHQARTAARRNFVTMKRATLTIQTWYRQQTRRQALKREEAATLIQAYVRRHLAVREVSVLRAALRREAAVVTIQNFCRTALARRKFQAFQLEVRKNRAAVKIQAGFRGFIARRQRQLLRHEARREQACITIQSAYRCCRAVRQFKIFQAAARQEQAATKIQSAIRKYLAVKKLKAFQLKAKREWAAVRIQAAWRRYIAVKELRILQLEARRRSAALKIQAAYRRHLALRQLKCLHLAAKQKAAAISIQCAYRRHVAVRQLKCLQKEAKRQAAAIRIQSSYRRHLSIRELRALQLSAKREASAVRIQSAYRGHLSRMYVHRLKETARQELAAKRIQAYIRGCLQRRHYLKMQRSVLLLQSHVRGYRARKNYRQMKEVLLILAEYHQTQEKFKAVIGEYHQRWKAAVTAQSAWRGWRHRHKFLTTKSSICKLQAAVRGRAQRKKYLLLRRSATMIQRWFRAHTAGRVTRLRYQLMLGAAVIIQSSLKMYIIRSYYLQLRARVICAQAQCRKFLARTKFQRQQRAAICIQRHYRAWAYSQTVQKEYQKSRHAIIRLQALFRAKQQRECLHRLRQSCITIQSAVRGWLAQRSYQNQRQSAVVLQRQWRACLQGRTDRKRFMETRAAIIIIQSHAQGYLARKHIHHIKQAASTIQKHYRGYQTRCQFLRYRKAAVTLQQHIRAFLVAQLKRKDLALARQACVRIQSAYRRHVTCQHYLRCRQRVVRLQAMVRGQQQRRRYLALYRATLWCQSHYRARRMGHVFRTAFLLIRGAAVIIQKHVRGHRSRQKYQLERSSIVLLQAHVRGWLQRQELNQQRQAVLVLQRRWRMKKDGEMKRKTFLHARRAAITIQRSWRLVQQARLQNTHSAATVIQKHVRRHLAQIRFRSEVMRITQTQAVVKGFLVRRAMSKQLCAVKLIQRRWKETLLARQCRRNFLLMVGSAVMIQSVFRGHRIRANFTVALKRIVLLQAVFRGYLQRRKYLQLQKTVLSLQRRVRNNITCRRERNHFLQQRNAAVCIQAAFRHWQRRCKDKKTRAAMCLQSYFRMLSVRKHFLRRRTAVIVLQSTLRGHQARQILRQKKAAILLIQHRVRFYLLVRSLRFKVHRRRQATLTIQRAFRKYLARVQSRKSRAAIRIQVAFRGFVQRQQFQRQKQAALTLQRGLRGWRDRQRVREMRNTVEAALLIQRHFRAWKQKREEEERRLQREEYLQHFTHTVKRRLAVVRIQRWYRQVMLMRQARQQLHCVIVLQRRVRGFLQRRWFLRVRQETQEMQARQERAARIIQSAVRSWRVQREERRRIQLITKVQAIWRGRRLRCGLKNKKIAKARRRVQEANEKATQEKTLGHRTTSALDFLLHYKQLAYILDALMHLDVATRLSSVCCERLVEVNAVGVIFRLILSCNRSLPHMELIKYSVSVLLNLAKYEKTAHAVYEADGSVTTLVDLMSIYREKGGAIFTKTCMLLALLGSDPQRKAEMCSDKRLVDKLQSIHVLVLRKHRMQMAHARQVAARASLNATLPSRLLHGPRAIRVRPAWVLRRDSLHDIEDPLAALSFVLDALHIGPK